MNHSGDAAEQIVRISLEGMEYALRIAGAGAKNIAAFLVAAIKSDNTGPDSKTKLKGKERLTNMLKSGKELKIFAIKNGELERFSKEAKRYGVVYCALKDKGGKPDSLVDIMAKAEDANKISRIMDRLQIATVDQAAVESQMAEQDRDAPDRDDTDKLLDMLIDAEGKAIPPSPPDADIGGGDTPHPTFARTAENRPSVSRYRGESNSAEDTPGTKKPESVKAFLRERAAAQRRKDIQPERAQPETTRRQQRTPPQHQQPQTRRPKSKKSKERV